VFCVGQEWSCPSGSDRGTLCGPPGDKKKGEFRTGDQTLLPNALGGVWTDAMPERGDLINGRYQLLEPLGEGAMGIVYAAVHIDTEKRLAIKWLSPALGSNQASIERFKLEAKATGRIHHPNVVAVYDCGEHDGQLYIVMELLEGQTLRSRLQQAPDGRLRCDEALSVMFPVLRGVAAAHDAGVLHRDLKPENVFLAASPDGMEPIPKVLDFGLAKLHTDVSKLMQLSMPGSLLGTFQYMAPEQLRPVGDLDARVDVYALGAMLYELLSGQPPHRADNPVDLVLQIHAAEPQPLSARLPDVSPQLDQVLARALSRDRAARYENVAAFAVALEACSARHRFRGVRSPLAAAAGDAPLAQSGSAVSVAAPPQRASEPPRVARKSAVGSTPPESRSSAEAEHEVAALAMRAGLARLVPSTRGGLLQRGALRYVGLGSFLVMLQPTSAQPDVPAYAVAADSGSAVAAPAPAHARAAAPAPAQAHAASAPDADGVGSEWEVAQPTSGPQDELAAAHPAEPSAAQATGSVSGPPSAQLLAAKTHADAGTQAAARLSAPHARTDSDPPRGAAATRPRNPANAARSGSSRHGSEAATSAQPRSERAQAPAAAALSSDRAPSKAQAKTRACDRMKAEEF
jgi:eukaryotic-like serine/threonine-protein kinase